jgi:hypothetical protein
MKRYRLTPQVRQQIVAGIRAGGYPHVAAEAWEIPRCVFEDWLLRGRAMKAREPYRTFAREVRAATAQARLKAEMDVFKDEPKVWLERGLGRETAESPGWTVAVKPAAPARAYNALADPALLGLFRTVLQALMPFPAARAHVAKLLTDLDFPLAA